MKFLERLNHLEKRAKSFRLIGLKTAEKKILQELEALKSNGVKVYLDDLRTPPEGWELCYWPDEVIELLKSGYVTHLSLDHDLGNDARGTGYDVILWLEEQVIVHGFKMPETTVHSANRPARDRMEKVLKALRRRKRT